MRPIVLWGCVITLVAAQLIAIDLMPPPLPPPPPPPPPQPAPPQKPAPGAPSSRDEHSAGEPGGRLYRGKPWYGLCEAYAADSVSALWREAKASPLLAKTLEGFDWGRARLVVAEQPQMVYANYAHSGKVGWTHRPTVEVQQGELLITDREDPYNEASGFLLRTHCCNEVRKHGPRHHTPGEPQPPEETFRLEWYLDYEVPLMSRRPTGEARIVPGTPGGPASVFPPTTIIPVGGGFGGGGLGGPVILTGGTFRPPGTTVVVVPPSPITLVSVVDVDVDVDVDIHLPPGEKHQRPPNPTPPNDETPPTILPPTEIHPVPEPTTLWLFLSGGLWLFVWLRGRTR